MQQDKETKILEAAEKVFLTKGFFPARMEDIAKKAGVAKGTLYLYFKDKTSIYVHLINHRLDESINVLEMIQNVKMSATAKLEQIFDGWAQYFSQAKGMTSFISIENINLTSDLMKEMEIQIKPKILKSIDLITQIIKNGIKNNEFKKINPRLGAMCFLDAVRTYFMTRLYFPDIKESEKTIKDMFLHGIMLVMNEHSRKPRDFTDEHQRKKKSCENLV